MRQVLSCGGRTGTSSVPSACLDRGVRNSYSRRLPRLGVSWELGRAPGTCSLCSVVRPLRYQTPVAVSARSVALSYTFVTWSLGLRKVTLPWLASLSHRLAGVLGSGVFTAAYLSRRIGVLGRSSFSRPGAAHACRFPARRASRLQAAAEEEGAASGAAVCACSGAWHAVHQAFCVGLTPSGAGDDAVLGRHRC